MPPNSINWAIYNPEVYIMRFSGVSSYFLLFRLKWNKYLVIAILLVFFLVEFSFFIANVFSFIVNKSWTFENWQYSDYHKQYMKFLTVSLGSVCIVEVILFVFVSVFHIYDLVAKLVGVCLSFVFAFLVHHAWTFKPATR